MRTDSFSKEKHLPVRRFIADESKVATGLYGPRAIADDLDNLFAMFDPEATFLDGSEQGGISGRNLQNGAVSYEKLGEEVKLKFQGIATEEQLSALRGEMLGNNDLKADKANTLFGYGITDAYTKEEADHLFLDKEAFSLEKKNLITTDNLNKAIETIHSSVAHKLEETVLYEDVVNTPKWNYQPTYEGTLDSAFNTNDYYYVTLKDADGIALPRGQFMLKSSFDTSATVYSTVFTLENLYIGAAKELSENYPVEFVTIGNNVVMRDAGVVSISQIIPDWNLDGGTGTLRVTVHGEFIQKNLNGYFYPMFQTNKNVESYHSSDGAAESLQSASTKQIFVYVPMAGTRYSDNRIYDDCIIERNGSGYFSLKRYSAIKYLSNRVKYQTCLGYGNVLEDNTNAGTVVFRVNNGTNGMIRNGTYIRVAEVR